MIIQREFDIIQNIASCPSLTKRTSIAGFFSKKQYAAMAERELAMKLLKERCLECSIWAMFFNSSLTVSIKACFLSKILLAMLIRLFFMLFFTFVTSCISLRNRFSNRACPICPLSAHNFPFMFSKNLPCFKGSRSSTCNKQILNRHFSVKLNHHLIIETISLYY